MFENLGRFKVVGGGSWGLRRHDVYEALWVCVEGTTESRVHCPSPTLSDSPCPPALGGPPQRREPLGSGLGSRWAEPMGSPDLRLVGGEPGTWAPPTTSRSAAVLALCDVELACFFPGATQNPVSQKEDPLQGGLDWHSAAPNSFLLPADCSVSHLPASG